MGKHVGFQVVNVEAIHNLQANFHEVRICYARRLKDERNDIVKITSEGVRCWAKVE